MRMRKFSCPAPIALLAAVLALPLFFAACASSPQRMTRAALAGDTAALDDLLKAGSPTVDTPITLDVADPACPGHRSITPLQAAACAGQEAAVRKLLAGKADINLAAGSGHTPLLLAVANGRDDVARLLVQSGVGLEIADGAGNTPLMLGARKGNRSLAEFLLKNGASPQARNRAGETALLLCADPGIAKMLAGLGADPLAVNANGESGLHLAARTGNAGMARFFLERGVEVSLRNKGDESALDIARGGGGAPDALSKDSGARSGRQQSISQARRRVAPGAGAQAAPEIPDSAREKSGAVAVIEEWTGQLLRKELAAGDKAAGEGRSAEALGMYAAALSRAGDAGGAAEQELRVKIVRFAASLPQPPGIPEKAREHLVRGSYLLKKGQDIGLVEKEMAAALRIAPWWAEGYYNLGQLQAEQGKFEQAERNLGLFIAAAPGDSRAQAAQDKIYEIRMAKEEVAKFRGMQGRWVDENGHGYSVSVNGDKLLLRSDAGLAFTLTNRNGVLEGSAEGPSHPGDHGCTFPGQIHPVNGKLAPDARGITLEFLWSKFKTNHHYVNMMGVVVSNNCLTCDEVCDAVTVSATNRISHQLRPAM